MKIASFLYQKLLAPRLSDEDGKRQEFILNILLVSLSVLFLVLSLQIVFAMFFDPGKTGASPLGALVSLLIYLALLGLSRFGYPHAASFLLVGVFLVFVTYANYMWGPDLPMAILFYCFIIILSGILISSRFSFIISLFVSISLFY